MTQARTVIGDRRPPSRGERQRGRIIEAVVDLLGSVPIADLSVMRIAEHAGVTRPAFYFYFESKYAVVAAALDEAWAELDAATDELTRYEFEEPPAVFSRRMIGQAIDVWQRYMPLMNACMQARESDPQLAEMWTRLLGNLSGKLAAFIDRLRESGQTTPVIDDTQALTHALVGMTVWALHEHHLRTESIDLDRVMAAIRAIWLAAAWGTGRADGQAR